MWGLFGKRKAVTPITEGEHFRGSGTIAAIDELHTAPLSNKACVYWVTTVKVPEAQDDADKDRARLLRSARALAEQDPFVLMKKSKVPMETHQRYGSSVFAVELPQGRLVIDGEDAEIRGPPLVIIPRNLARERALLEEWELLGGTGPAPAFSELVLQVGDRVDIGGVVERVGDELRLVREVTLTLRR